MKNKDKKAPRKGMKAFGLSALLAVTAATAQVATLPGTDIIDNSGNYRSEVQSCMTGKTQQDQATCLREARNAQADKKHGVLENGAQVQGNAMSRCDVFQPGEEKAACQARVMGYGNVEGSVSGGGVIREVETVVMPKDQSSVTIQPQTNSDTVILQPSDLRR